MNPINQVTTGVTSGVKSTLNVKNIVIIILTALVLYLLAKRFLKERIVLTKNADGSFEGTIERKVQLRKDDPEADGDDYDDSEE